MYIVLMGLGGAWLFERLRERRSRDQLSMRTRSAASVRNPLHKLIGCEGPQQHLVRVTTAGVVVAALLAVVGTLLLQACAPSQSATQTGSSARTELSAAIYPPPIAGCPNLTGATSVKSLSPQDRAALLGDLNTLADPASRQGLIAIGDQTVWSVIGDNWPKAVSGPHYESAGIVIQNASGDSYASVVEHACGAPALQDSWVAVFCDTGGPVAQCDAVMTEHAFFLERSGVWLVWAFWP
jgi:hypothetical protein